MNRRSFLAASSSAPILLKLFQESAAYAEPVARHAPYLKLDPFRLPGADEFSGEAPAMEAEAALLASLSSLSLPRAEGFEGHSLLPEKWKRVEPDISVAVFG